MNIIKNIIFIFILINVVLVTSKKSFTLIIDTTKSMNNEIFVIKRNMPSVLRELGTSELIENYMLLTFKDPVINVEANSTSVEGLISSLSRLSVSGGGECPENSMTAIERGLEASNPESYIFVFTDAYAKDSGKLSDVQNLCETKRSQVVIFLNGYCDGSNSTQVGSSDGYYRVARACNGTFFQMSSDFRQAFKLISEITKEDWTEIVTHDTFTNYHEFSITTDFFATEFLVIVFGNNPSVEIITSNGRKLRNEKVITATHFTVVRLNSEETEYTMRVHCRGTASATFYKKQNFPFQYGFSTRMPKSLKETSLRPIQGTETYLVVPVSQNSVEINKVDLQIYNSEERRVILLERGEDNKFFTNTATFNSLSAFRITISGQNTATYESVTSSTRILTPQKPSTTGIRRILPSLEIIAEPEDLLVESGADVIVPCKVTAYPHPSVSWKDESGALLSAEEYLVEDPSVYIIYGSVTNITQNTSIICEARDRYNGVSKSLSVDLFVKRTYYIDGVQTPADTTVEYGQEGRLYCRVDARPTPTITWYHNDTIIEQSDKVNFEEDNAVLTINSMDVEDAGKYHCKVSTSLETQEFSANVDIAGLETPELSVFRSEYAAKPDDSVEIECSILRGKPEPEIQWSFKPHDAEYFTTLPIDVNTDGKKINIPSVKKEHGGFYRCEAMNLLGQDYKDVSVTVQYPPVIKHISSSTLVTEGDDVEIICEVEAVPRANVHWKLIQDGHGVALDNRHSTDDGYVHRFFNALSRDSGEYHCIAENVNGIAEEIVSVNVLADPIIEPPNAKNITLRAGMSVTLKCNVLYGNPIPTTTWEFTAPDSTTIVLTRGRSSNDLDLINVSSKDEGTYSCLARNEAGFDQIEIHVKVI